jgi:hypothetical protein
MKKFSVLLLIITMIGTITATASASPICTNVPPGYDVFELDAQFVQGMNDYCPSFIAGLNDQIALGMMYDTYFKYYAVMGRYAPVKNVATDLYYRLDGSNSWMADLRGKYYFNQSLNISGKLYYDSLDTSNLQILGQAEYLFNQEWVGNAGLFNSNQTTFLVLGAAFEKGVIAVGIDGVFPTTNFSNPMIALAIDYLIKK